MTPATSSALADVLGIEPERLGWRDLALCNAIENPEVFFSEYESNPRTAKAADELCLSCPVRKQCLAEGLLEKETGCWGAVYLNNGKVDRDKNKHKTKEVWEELGL